MPRSKQPAVAGESFDFEAAVREIETLVERMEGGDLSLEESLREFERAVKLTGRCRKVLAEAEQKVRIITAGGDEAGPDAEEGGGLADA